MDNDIDELNFDEGIEDSYDIYIQVGSPKFINILNLLNINENGNIRMHCLMYENKLNILLSKYNIFIYVDNILIYTLFFYTQENFINNKYYKLIYNKDDYIQSLYINNNNELCFEILDNNYYLNNYLEIFIFNSNEYDLIYCKLEKIGGKCVSNIFDNNLENINLEHYNNYHNFLINRHLLGVGVGALR
jgi:hypothetical protein